MTRKCTFGYSVQDSERRINQKTKAQQLLSWSKIQMSYDELALIAQVCIIALKGLPLLSTAGSRMYQ